MDCVGENDMDSAVFVVGGIVGMAISQASDDECEVVAEGTRLFGYYTRCWMHGWSG